MNSLEQVKFYAAQLALALEHLHQNMIIYRDLKPENILLDGRGFIKLSDFGLAKKVSSLEKSSDDLKNATFCGTPEYLSPEMIFHRSNLSGYTNTVDWWSLGVVCFELMTGCLPFYHKDFSKLCEKILHDRLTFPNNAKSPKIHASAQNFVKGLLTRQPTARLQISHLSTINNSTRRTSVERLSLQLTNILDESSHSFHARPKDLITHEFFEGMEWDALINQTLEPPYIPLQGESVYDTCNFDSEFTKIAIEDNFIEADIDIKFLHRS